jgi:hypothetical protein
MIVYRTQIDKKEYCWFHSTNVLHSEVDLSTSKEGLLSESGIPGLKGIVIDVKIVFNRGATYIYRNVPIHDYVAFVEHLNRDDFKSSGKSFNKFIKIYPFEQISDTNLDNLEKFKLEQMKSDLQKRRNEMTSDEKVGDIFNILINDGNVTSEELIEWYGQELFDKAWELSMEYWRKI